MDALAIIMRLGGGRLLEELGDALQKVSDEVVETGQAGSITVKLAVKPLGRVGDVEVAIEETISVSPPKRPGHAVIFYAVDGALHLEDVRQSKLPFRTVESSASAAARDTEAAPLAAREV
jgi:hypothetical protein